ncbi:MAG TPA: glycosyltransferase family 2 protein [Thermoanaerobaculia bacterium]|nr:glycosyltransferase family 2 protein [Thermoanaerobaculia bacterium]
MNDANEREMRVAAIVPAYNEEETLADVLSVLKSTDLVDEVLVVSDGSTDQTVGVARAMGIKGIHLKSNQGKGVAMAVGVAQTRAPVLVFVDGDILKLSDYLLSQLIDPVVQGEVAMSIGVRNRGWLVNMMHRRTGPLLSGIRCLKREIFEAVPAEYQEGFRIETALNWACRRLGLKSTSTVLYGLKHRVKEKKRGFSVGLHARFSMFSSVFIAWLTLKLRPPVLRAIDVPAAAHPELDYIDF